MMYQLTNLDSGKTFTISEKDARKQWGASEWREMKAGYLPQWIVLKL